MNAENPQNELPPNLKAKLEQFRRAVWVVKIAEGLLAAVFGLVISYLVVFGLDRFWETPQVLRALILVGGFFFRLAVVLAGQIEMPLHILS